MASSIIQRAFTAGEIAPSLAARADLARYQTGAATVRNFVVQRFGGIENRAGTEFIAEAKDSEAAVRTIPFIFSDEQTYVLVFSDLFLRFIRNGAPITETATTISGATAANPVALTITAHPYSTGDEIYVSGVVGMTQLNGKNFHLTSLDANTVSLQTLDDVDVDGSAYTAYTSGGAAERIYTLATPYLVGDLPTLQYEQSGDIVTLTHPSYAVRELRRLGHTNWELTTTSFSPGILGPTDCRATSAPGSDKTFKYRITAIKAETYEESLRGYERARTVIAFDRTVTPWTATSVAHGYDTGDEVLITSDSSAFLGLTGQHFTITIIDSDTFSLDGTVADSGATGAQEARRTHIEVSADVPTEDDPIVLEWDAVEDAVEYNIYRALNGVYGYIGTAGGTTFEDVDIAPDTSDQPPTDRVVFDEADEYPSTAAYFQQRLCFGNTNNNPQKAWCSQIGNFHNVTISTPENDDDAVVFTVSGGLVQAIRHMLDLGKLTLFTAGSVWTVRGDADGVLKPGAINLQRSSNVGCSTLKPIAIGQSAVFVQARESVVRNLRLDLQSDSFRDGEVSLFSGHLFAGHTIVDWCYQENHHSVVWAVRDDGVLLGMTYMPEQEVIGWHRHDTQGGYVENVCCVPEGDEDALYLIVRRTIDGHTRRYIERLHTRFVTDVTTDAFFVDCGLTYDGRNTADRTMTLTGGTDWTADEDLTLTSSYSLFTAAEVGNAIMLYVRDDEGVVTERLVCNITAYTRATVVTVNTESAVSASFQGVAISDWARAVDVVDGLDHLEGETVAILADGHELARQEVADGQITLDDTYAVIHVGLPIEADLETLALETISAETFADKKKLVTKVTALVAESRGMKVGPNEDELSEWVQRTTGDGDNAIPLYTGPVEILTDGTWDNNGKVFIRQSSPLPLTILAVVPSGLVSRS